MAQFTQLFTFLLIVQMFYAFSVSVFVPMIPEAQQQQIIMYTDERGVINFVTLGTEIEGAVNSQTTTPFLNFGSLIFYSTSLILNLVINFITAIPQMVSWLLIALFMFFPVSQTIQISVKTIFVAMVTVLYFLLLVLYIMGVRTQSRSFG